MRNIVLCGFMGCGKTTVGRQLASLAGRRFIDMDRFIEEEAGLTVAEIFRLHGEAAFRRRESDACVRLAQRRELVIAAGGGALTAARNVEALATGCDIVLLRVTPETVLARLDGDETRPLLMRADKEAAVRELFAERLPLYEKAAHLQVDGEQPPLEVAKAILAALDGRTRGGKG